MKFKNFSPEELAKWVISLKSSPLMDCHNKIKLWGEIHVDNTEPDKPEEEDDE